MATDARCAECRGVDALRRSREARVRAGWAFAPGGGRQDPVDDAGRDGRMGWIVDGIAGLFWICAVSEDGGMNEPPKLATALLNCVVDEAAALAGDLAET